MRKSTEKPEYICNLGSLVSPVPLNKRLSKNPVLITRNTWIKILDGKIVETGAEGESLPAESINSIVFDAEGMLATPGLIDAHTHPIFVNNRQNEFVRRSRGESYQQIAAAGGGIVSSIQGVRKTSQDELAKIIQRKLDGFIFAGTTSIEAKSGYGLSLQDELKSLRALKQAADNHPLDVSSTLLAAHVVPPEFKIEPDKYVDLICNEIIPQVVEEGLAAAIDVFLEEGAFNATQTRKIFSFATESGLRCKLHADQFNSGEGAAIAVEFNALTADHMDQTNDEDIKALAEKGVTVVLLPGAVFFLGLDKYAPARKMIDAGCKIALSTDYNPGTTPTQSLPLIMTLACIKMGLSPSEALWAVTMGGAYAINKADHIGSLMQGYDADICLWNAEDVDFIPYAYGNMMPEVVFKKGKLVAQRQMQVIN
ncbi:imidazolonepropionase [bacterium]|nr:imidazolonepropionase [bacterium]